MVRLAGALRRYDALQVAFLLTTTATLQSDLECKQELLARSAVSTHVCILWCLHDTMLGQFIVTKPLAHVQR